MSQELKRKISWFDFGLALGVSFLMVLLPRYFMVCNYSMVDDKTIIRVLSGCTSGVPDGHAIFMQYPLTWIIARLYQLRQGMDWYLVVMLLIYVISSTAVLYRLLRRYPGHRILISLSFVVAFYGLWLGRLCNLTFTTVGAFAAGALILVYALQPKELDHRPANLTLTLLLFCFTYTVRIVFCGMALPFLGIIWLWKHWKNLRSRSCWVIPLCAALCAGCMFGMNKLAYASPEWQSFLAYNDERSYLEDFDHFPDYEEHQEFITSLGLTKEEYGAVRNMDYALVGSYSPEVTKKLYEYALTLDTAQPLAKKLKQTVIRTVRYYFNLKGKERWNLLTIQAILLPAGLLLTAVWAAWKKKKLYPLVFPLMNLSCEALLWLYIGYCNRGPFRVLVSLRLVTGMAALVGLYLLGEERREAIRMPAWTGRRICGLALAAALCVTGVCQFLTAQKAQKQVAPVGASPLCDYAAEHPDNIYVLDTYSGKYIKSILVPVNLFYTGGWVIYSPLYQQKLDACSLDAMNRETLLEENVYLVLDSKKRNLHAVLGVSAETQVDYTVVESFGTMQVYEIHSIAGLER